MLGEVACGIPKYAEENIETYLELPRQLVGEGTFYILRASGDSMTEAGIDDGDLVVIRKQSAAEPGDIVVALVGYAMIAKTTLPAKAVSPTGRSKVFWIRGTITTNPKKP